jgi:hypothetical protein
MKSPLAAIGMFRKTKKRDWAFKGIRMRRAELNRNEGLDISQFLPKEVEEKIIKVNFQPKTSIYRFANGRIVTGKNRFEEVKLAAKSMGFTAVKLGGLRPVKV